MLESEQFLVKVKNNYTEIITSTVVPSRIELAKFLRLLEQPGLKGKYEILKMEANPHMRNFGETVEEFSEVVEKFKGQKQLSKDMEFGA